MKERGLFYRWLRMAIPARYRLWLKFQGQALKIGWLSLIGRVKYLEQVGKPDNFSGLKVIMVYPEMGNPTRYRVINQAAQLELMDCRPVLYNIDDLKAIQTLATASILYLYRVESTPPVRKLIQLARQQHIPVIFDTDDLIWDARLEAYCYLRKHWSDQEIDDFLASVKRHKMIMEQVDYFVVSTPYLANLVHKEFNQTIYVNKNALSQAIQTISEPFYQARIAGNGTSTSPQINIGYISGTRKAHEEDFEFIIKPLCRILRDRPLVCLTIVGHLNIVDLIETYGDRVQYQPFINWHKIPEFLSEVDINLAPIVDNPQRRSKSGVKFLEAALLGIPTVASNLEPYQDIQHGQTGFLATTEDEWYHYLCQLIDSPELRQKVGLAARHQILEQDTVQIRTHQFRQIFQQIIEDYYS